MKRKSLSQLIYSFENLTGDSIEGSENVINAGAVVDVIDYIDGEDNTNEMQQAALLASKASEELGIFTETNDQLEQFVAEKTELLENGVVTGDDVMIANEALAQACALYGIQKPVVCSFESIAQDPKEALRVTLEGIGETISKGYNAVIDFFKKLFAGIWKFIKGLFGSTEDKADNISKSADSLKETVTNIGNVKFEPLSSNDVKDVSNKVNGKSPEAAAAIIKAVEVVDPVAKIEMELLALNTEVFEDIKVISVLGELESDLTSAKGVNEAIGKIIQSFLGKNEVVNMCQDLSRNLDTIKKQIAKINKDTTSEQMSEMLLGNIGSIEKIEDIENSVGSEFKLYLKGTVKELAPEVYDFISDFLGKELKNSCNIDSLPIFKITKNDDGVKIIPCSKVIAFGLSMVNNKLHAKSKVFSVEGKNSVLDVKITPEILKDMMEVKDDINTLINTTNSIKKIAEKGREVSKQINGEMEKGIKICEDFVKELETLLNKEEIVSKIDIQSFFTAIRNSLAVYPDMLKLMNMIFKNVESFTNKTEKILLLNLKLAKLKEEK